MENEITAHKAGMIAELPIKEGDADRRPAPRSRSSRATADRDPRVTRALRAGHSSVHPPEELHPCAYQAD